MTGHDFVYLIDSGLMHDHHGHQAHPNRRDHGQLASTLAPERFDTAAYDASADIYAFAVLLLHECLTGAQPYPGDSLQQRYLPGTSPLTLLSQADLNPTIPAGFDAVIARGMAKDPHQRYPSAHDLAADARRALTTSSRNAQSVFDSSRSAPTRHHRPVYNLRSRPGRGTATSWQSESHGSYTTATAQIVAPQDTDPTARPGPRIGAPPPSREHRRLRAR